MTSRLSRSLYHFVVVALCAFVCHVLGHQISSFEGRFAITIVLVVASVHAVKFVGAIWSTADVTPAIDVQQLEIDQYRERYALGLLAEEAGEVAQMCGKALRFGLDSPNSHKENEKITRDQLAIEIGDFIAAARYAEARGYVDWCRVSDQTAKKYAKLASPNSRDQLGRRSFGSKYPDMFEAPVKQQVHFDTRIAKSEGDIEWDNACRRDDDVEYMATGRVTVSAVIKRLFQFDGDQPVPWLTFTGGAGGGGWNTLVYANRNDHRREIILTILTSVPSSIGSRLDGYRGRSEQVSSRYFERIDSKASGSLLLVCRSKLEMVEMVEVQSKVFLSFDRARAIGYVGVKQWVAQQVVEALFHEVLESVMIDNRLAFQAQVDEAHRNG